MKEEEKKVLEKAIKSNDGLLSPATMINSFSGGNRSVPENLVALGYLEIVPEEIGTGTTINFYRVTEKGFSVFYPIYKRLWYYFSGDLRTIIVSVITALITTIIITLIKN